jgi:hypothetical protein
MERALFLVAAVALLGGCSLSGDDERSETGEVPDRTVEVTQTITVEETVREAPEETVPEETESEEPEPEAEPERTETPEPPPEEEPPPEPEPEPEPRVASAPTSLVLGDTEATDLGNELTVLSYEQPLPTEQYFEPEPGFEYAAIDVEGCAGSGSETSLNPYSFTLQMRDNTRLQSDVPIAEPPLNAVTLPPGDCVRGYVTFRVPEGETPRYVVFDESFDPIKWSVDSVERPEVEDPTDSEEANSIQRFVSDYYAAVARQDWSATYALLDAETQGEFTEGEWYELQEAREAGQGLPTIDYVEVDDYQAYEGSYEATVTRTYADGTQDTLDIVLYEEGDGLARHLTGEELEILRGFAAQ